MPAGRPTDYRPHYGEAIIELMTTGLSLTAAAAELGFHRQRVYEWEEAHPEFADAVKLARGKRTLKLERDLLMAPDGPTVTSRIFALKNAAPDEWREKQEVEMNMRSVVVAPQPVESAEAWLSQHEPKKG